MPGRIRTVVQNLVDAKDRFSPLTARELQCPATVSVIGAFSSQEAIKACSNIHTPLSQIFVFESLDSLLPIEYRGEKVLSYVYFISSTDVINLIYNFLLQISEKDIMDEDDSLEVGNMIYGRALTKELSDMNLFIVGSGAIGCELLKNMALMGVCTGKGSATLADMDNIERSNLNRQLLFREEHVGNAKATVAAAMIKFINKKFNCKAVTNKVCDETETVFDAEFWSRVDVVLTALDNVDARLYIDRQCVLYGKWLLDSGTLGTKGNVQVVIPFVSESYASSADPPEQAIPMCTLKSFPYQPEHCIGWARATFDQFFCNNPR